MTKTKQCNFYKCEDDAMKFHPSGMCFQCYQKDPRYFTSAAKKQLKVLDLFSGLGGFSEAFLLNKDEVLRIENNPLLSGVENTVMMDVLKLRDIIRDSINSGELNPYLQGIDVILSSPPCYEFSLAFSAPQAIASRNGEFESYSPDMELIHASMEIIEMLKPRYWIIENVRGSIRHFEKIGLKPHQKLGAYVLYGNFPQLSVGKLETKKKKDVHSGNPLRSNIRAKIPLELSEAIRKAILSQKTIFDFGAEEE